MTVLKLAAKQTTADEIKTRIVGLLLKTLEEAKEGNIDAIILIAQQPGGEWVNRTSDTMRLSDMIGRLEVTKHELIANFLESEK